MLERVLYHDHCFDGAASAAFFSRFIAGGVHPGAEFRYTGMAHKASQMFDDALFDGDENAIVDFKYSASPKLTWWFDHHQSAFLTPEDEAHFRADRGGKKFLDPTFKSCTKFIATTAAERFGFDAAPMRELIHWADIIDGASYRSAAEAVEMKAPALRLALVIESDRDQGMIERIITDLQAKSLSDVAAAPYVEERVEPLYARHLRALEIIRGEARAEAPVVFFDVSEHDMEGYSKFIPYYLHPESTYSVGVSHSSFRSKISVGSNPWAPRPRTHDLAKICERYGGGGHAVVAAISLPPDSLDEARRIAAEIVRELRQGGGE